MLGCVPGQEFSVSHSTLPVNELASVHIIVSLAFGTSRSSTRLITGIKVVTRDGTLSR